MRLPARPVLRPGGADCERLGSGLLTQPVNAWSSLSYVVAAGVVVSWLPRLERAVRLMAVLFAVAVALNGVGGLAYHGGDGAFFKWVHDLGIAATIAVILVHDAGRLRGRPTAPAAWALVLWGAAGIVLAVAPELTNAVDVVLAVPAVVLEVLVVRRGVRPVGPGSPARLGYALLAASAAAAGLLKWAGGTDGPLCRPDSVLQGHAGWHALTAAAMAAWAWGAFAPARTRQPA